jgi:hypothetical protein
LSAVNFNYSMTNLIPSQKLTIGRSELIDFVDLGLQKIPAKIDTGAYRSAIHASSIKLDTDSGVLSFDLLAGHPVFGKDSVHIETNHFQMVTIENSFGHSEERYEVTLKVKMHKKIISTKFTLANRTKKIFPILLGRKLMNRRFIVDPSRTGIDRVKLKHEYKISFPVDEEEKYRKISPPPETDKRI